MRKVVYYLSTCDTCKKIMAQLELDDFDKIDIKNNPLTEPQLLELYVITESYEELFNKRAIKFRQRGLNKKELSENDYKKLLLEEYTFLKRPVFLINGDLYVGNAKKNVEQLKERIGK
ncbi:arsenate reductase [Marivirga tractuosa]|uniref:Arsenate reductase-like protein n=1 Tax=Marivirga tractuosa (strain ATCC 23168 / DSM 4126 / NBRC 15989 / NCIMB 1408 / VKM B-1430 / H-43) TaxID=643867 RepID=E4TP85_MARTH|nr:ArsC/Spx/MgsR family protein [Marivirga tractuosa]ADR20488.1 arsenate reductase-like protein [Marivirga tractuosa DSM 4126]BDD15066.1 arsenate reductase [Marivirga tractuosa]